MRTTDTIIVGGGQAGLSLSRYLARAGHPHAVLERGRIGERWRSERWDSLRLLTPNWLNRLDGGEAHADPDGYLSRVGFVDSLRRYARAAGAPVQEHVTVRSVERWGAGFHVATDAGEWRTRVLVVATGDSADPRFPSFGEAAPRQLRQLHASRYRHPAALPAGGVLVVGAGPSGQQIAAELRRSGRRVVLAVGRHARSMRRYRGRDLWYWLAQLGDLERTIEEVHDPTRARRTPSLTLSGANGGEQLDLDTLQALGVTVTGRLAGFREGKAEFSGDLRAEVDQAERRMHRLLDRIDDHVDRVHGDRWPAPSDRVRPIEVGAGPAALDLVANRFSTVIWATGFRREYPWLHVPALDAEGEIVQRSGISPVPGLYTLGLKFQRRRASHFIGGVGADAAYLARRIA